MTSLADYGAPAHIRLSQLLGRRAVPLVASLVIVSFGLTVALLVQIAMAQDRSAITQEHRFADRMLDRLRAAIARDVKDYAAWGEAYQHMHLTTDVGWAFEQQNLGKTLYADLQYEQILVVSPSDVITYAVVDGRLVSEPPTRLLNEGLQRLVDEARAAPANQSRPAVGFVEDTSGPLLMAATAITTGGDPTIEPTPGTPSILVFADALTVSRLDEIGRLGFLNGLGLQRRPSDPDASMPLLLADGVTQTWFQWSRERPGLALLTKVGPWLLSAALAIILLATLLFRRAMRTARLIDSRTKALADAHRQAEHAAFHDAATGLPNRLKLQRHLEQELARDPERPVSLVYIDLDRFKPVNDRFGHRAGDEVLRIISARLVAAARPQDLVARIGGDEFVVVMAGESTAQTLDRHCSTFVEAVRSPIELDNGTVSLGASLGLASAPSDGGSPEQLLQSADVAMYQAKLDGGNRFVRFSSDLIGQTGSVLVLEQDLRRALAAREIILEFQPRYDAASLDLVAVETLVRWQHPSRGRLMPGAFIAVAEQTGCIMALGAWVLREACAVAAAFPDLAVSVNISALQLNNPAFVDDVATALQQSGLRPDRLELELTESLLVDPIETACTAMHRLKSLGVKLALDDFGTGFSALAYLRRLPFDRLKIDRQFVSELPAHDESRAIVRAILSLARALKLKVTGEGVETSEQLALLRAEGCDEVQGFGLSHPVSEAGLHDLVKRRQLSALAG